MLAMELPSGAVYSRTSLRYPPIFLEDVSMIFRRFLRHRGFGVHMLACLAFLGLAVFGWKMPIGLLLYYLAITVGCLVVVIGAAFLAGYLLRKFMQRKEDEPWE